MSAGRNGRKRGRGNLGASVDPRTIVLDKLAALSALEVATLSHRRHQDVVEHFEAAEVTFLPHGSPAPTVIPLRARSPRMLLAPSMFQPAPTLAHAQLSELVARHRAGARS